MLDLNEHDGNVLSSRAKWAFAVFAIIGGFFLLAEHRAHVLRYLPWVILLACPLMHLFMHGGHGGHHGGGDRPRGRNEVPPTPSPKLRGAVMPARTARAPLTVEVGDE